VSLVVESFDYSGRTVDLLAYQDPATSGLPLVPSFFDEEAAGGRIVTGIRKLSQRFIVALLTERGSMVFFPLRGNDFVLQARQGRLRSTHDAIQAMAIAMLQIESQLLEEESEDDPLDERFARAELQSLQFVPGAVSTVIQLYSLAGESRIVVAPVPTVI
jgi:hypothetical protein